MKVDERALEAAQAAFDACPDREDSKAVEVSITAYLETLASLPGAGAGEPAGWKAGDRVTLPVSVGFASPAASFALAAAPASPAPASLPSEEAATPDGVIQAMAASDAKFDGREWLGMSRTDRERYLDRSRASFAAALGSMLNPLR